MYVLNSTANVSRGSQQYNWLEDELKANPNNKCSMTLFHYPLFSSGENGDTPFMRDIWRLLYETGVDIVISGHEHLYERFASQDHNGNAAPDRGIRQFTVGTGGAPLYRIMNPSKPNREIINNQTYGVLVLTLADRIYLWEFIPIEGQSFRDFGIGRCYSEGQNPSNNQKVLPF